MRTLFLLILLPIAPCLRAEVRPAALFTDHAVLQQERPIPVWGTAAPGESVTVIFGKDEGTTRADPSGHWQVNLPAVAGSNEARDLAIRGQNEIVLHDVLVGEVWLASGQSNMERTLDRTQDVSLDAATAGAFPTIRHIKVAKHVAATPADDVTSDAGWQVSGPETVARFSAIAYYFAREVHLALDVPVGIIDSTWGGTNIESWISQTSLEADPAAPEVARRWAKILTDFPNAKTKFDDALAHWEKERAAAEAAGTPFEQRRPRPPADKNSQQYPSNLYNAMINGLRPVALQGVIWYQGESNAGRATQYRTLFPTLIRDWRQAFSDEELDFFWVQLSSFDDHGRPDDRNWAVLRDAQTGALDLPHTGQAVTIDIGNIHDVHPRDKLDVGRRLARLALHRTYGYDIPDRGPVLASAEHDGDGYRLAFDAVYGGLITRGRELGGFELAGADRDFYPADAVIENDKVFVRSESVVDPVAVRYAWRNAPEAGLFNVEGLPATPFRTDDW